MCLEKLATGATHPPSEAPNRIGTTPALGTVQRRLIGFLLCPWGDPPALFVGGEARHWLTRYDS